MSHEDLPGIRSTRGNQRIVYSQVRQTNYEHHNDEATRHELPSTAATISLHDTCHYIDVDRARG